MREVAPVQWDQRGDLRRDDVRRLPRRWKGLVPSKSAVGVESSRYFSSLCSFVGRQRWATDAGEDGAMVLDRHRLGGLLVRAAGPARNLPSRCENGRLDNVRHQLVAERKNGMIERDRESFSL